MLQTETTNVPWLLEPYLPKEGIVFLYGKKGVGKSALTWALARSIASGEPWLGLPVAASGTVLYVEVDSPLSLIQGRFQGQQALPERVYFYFPSNPVLCSREGIQQVRQETKDVKPELVIINTLRKVHVLKDTESSTVAQVYGVFKTLFPGACLLFVHHEKKTPSNPDHAAEEGEEFSGSLAWHNDANVCLQLCKAPGVPRSDGAHNLILKNTGNQLHALAQPFRILLGSDGFTLSPR